jgi:hypothetical protein
LISHGYNQTEAIGIISNLYIESKCDSKTDNGSQIGIAQWQGNRKRNLFSYAKFSNRSWMDLYVQLEFLDQEWKQIIQRKSHVAHRPTSYTIYFCSKFERPKFSCSPREKVSKLKPWEK